MCMLVVIGADADGNKEVLAVEPGYRESATSWKELLLRLRDRGLKVAPETSHCRWRAGFLGCDRRGLSLYSRTTLLGA